MLIIRHMKFTIFIILALFSCIAVAKPASAESPISGVLYEIDPGSKNGFREKYRWTMNRTDEWRRFEYLTPKMQKLKAQEVNPFITSPQEVIVLSVKDMNGITGKDYYLSKNGIMVSAILAKNRYFPDKNDMYSMLREELTRHTSFEMYPGEKIATDKLGIIVRYHINETLPNPSWLVNKQADVNLYDGFLRHLNEYKSAYSRKLDVSSNFEKMGTFTLWLNYPEAPAQYVTVSDTGLRFSDNYTSETYIKDEKKYYDYFYNLAMENANTGSEVKTKDKKILERGQF